MDTAALVRVARQQVKLATRGLDRDGLLEMCLDEIPVKFSTRPAHCRMGFFTGAGPGDVGYIGINLNLCDTEIRFLETLYHELAHAVCHWMHGREADVHGPKWKAVMAQLGQIA